MGLFTKRQLTGQVDKNSLPRHVAVIMDGNGRWAQKRGLPRSAGHKAGAESFRRLGTYCKKLGIDYLTVYAFSTENWKRPPEEIDGIMQRLRRYLHECIDTMERDGNRLRFLGDLSVLDDDLKELIRETNEIMLLLNRAWLLCQLVIRAHKSYWRKTESRLFPFSLMKSLRASALCTAVPHS